jgi:NitT/TauT family transport system substrate-binding protein
MQYVYWIFCAVLSSLAFLDGSAKAAETDVKLVLDWAFQGQQAIVTVPADDGTFTRLGLNVTIDAGVGSGDTVTKVASGTYDMGFADLNAMIRFNSEHPDQKLIAVFIVNDKGTTGLAVKANGNIKTPKDLEGKRIASPQGDSSRQLFPWFARINNIDENKITWLNVTPALREPLLLRDETDAISGESPTILLNMKNLKVPESDIKIMQYVDFGLDIFGKALVVKPAYATKNSEVVQNLIRGMVKGLNTLIQNPDLAVASVKRRDQLLVDDIEKARIKVTLKYAIMTPNVAANGYSSVDQERLKNSLKGIGNAMHLTAIPDPSEIYTAAYLPPRGELTMARVP